MLYIILAILMFSLLIALHEFGHFLAAKLCGVRVNEFSIGMGPLLFAHKSRETQYSLRAVPIGGYCAMEGEEEDTNDPRSFYSKPAWKKLIILVAGSFMNFLTGFLIFGLLFAQASSFTIPVIDQFMDGFPLESQAQLLPGDRILSVNGEKIYTSSDLVLFFSRAEGDTMDLVIQRNGEKLERSGLPLQLRDYQYNGTTQKKYGLIFKTIPNTPLEALRQSWYQSIDMVRLVRVGLGDLITGRVGIRDMSGPIGIVGMMSNVGSESPTAWLAVLNILNFTAFIAINLAVMNLLPIPALDGGRVFFLLINGLFHLVTRKRIDPKYEGYVNTAGFACLILLMVIVAFNDITKLVGG
ncbi:MAG: site-2 protease family protein [Intestinimonas sp.]|jgi:regulator of sigma E protease|nr:site-2 protease family protein [Intestinimonas sp.]